MPMKKPDADARRLHPRLRVYANCDDEVNAVRADLSTAVTSTIAAKAAPQVHSLADDDPSDAQRQQLSLAPECRVGDRTQAAQVAEAAHAASRKARLRQRVRPVHAGAAG